MADNFSVLDLDVLEKKEKGELLKVRPPRRFIFIFIFICIFILILILYALVYSFIYLFVCFFL